jgi:transcriptional regulator with XRE-family HTH domain
MIDYNHASIHDIQEDIGLRLKNLRIDNGLKQSDVAEHLNISLNAVKNAEHGKNIKTTTLIAMFRLFDCLDAFEKVVPKQTISPREMILNNRPQRKRVR